MAIGHSAGGHPAIWAAGRSNLAAGGLGSKPAVQIAGVISLAGVLDLRAAARKKIVRCVHARADDRVPFAQSVTYVNAARSRRTGRSLA